MTRRLFVGLLSLIGGLRAKAPALNPSTLTGPRDGWMTAEVTDGGVTRTVRFRADGGDPYIREISQRLAEGRQMLFADLGATE